VFELRSADDIDTLYRMLRGMNRRAPHSVRFQVAVTVLRETTYRETVGGDRAGASQIREVLDRVAKKL
jgi:hypothetical protein